MSSLMEIVKEKELTLQEKMHQLSKMIHFLQKELSELYTAFTGDYVSNELSQI